MERWLLPSFVVRTGSNFVVTRAPILATPEEATAAEIAGKYSNATLFRKM
jgi:hypothetical protein